MSEEASADLIAAVESGDVLSILTAQRRLLAAEIITASPGVKPQFSNELNKLHVLIREEEHRLAAEAEAVGKSEVDVDDAFDPTAI